MYRTYILNQKELDIFNQNHNGNFKSVMIKQEGNKYYAILDYDIKIELHEKEIMKYLCD